jgi:DNA-binding PadR family transcriptional regulator
MREFLRGAIRLHVLHHAALGELNGAWMADELARHGYKVSPGTLYPTLHRMEEEGLLVSRRQVREGRVLRMYRATKEGRACLADGRAVLSELAGELLGSAPGRERGRRSS